jgi:hypothetical protein
VFISFSFIHVIIYYTTSLQHGDTSGITPLLQAYPWLIVGVLHLVVPAQEREDRKEETHRKEIKRNRLLWKRQEKEEIIELLPIVRKEIKETKVLPLQARTTLNKDLRVREVAVGDVVTSA